MSALRKKDDGGFWGLTIISWIALLMATQAGQCAALERIEKRLDAQEVQP